ncbi:MAG: hypothetical protein ACRDKV_06320 [Solirubrobacterales bacterium]
MIALLFLAAFAKLDPLSLGLSLARGLATSLLCAVRSEDCEGASRLASAYGPELAAAVRAHAPEVVYERGMRALPVDYRRCRRSSCADRSGEGRVSRSASGEPATAFVRLIDCRRSAGIPSSGETADCSAQRAGNLYLQYWFFYPDSATLRGVPVAGRKGYHRDDWETYQVRVSPGGRADVRASSHRGYNYEQGAANWASEAGIGFVDNGVEAVGLRRRDGWGPETGLLFVSGGSHAGNAKAVALRYSRFTPARRLRLIPFEALAGGETRRFAISPPWGKQVWRDPEAEGTD